MISKSHGDKEGSAAPAKTQHSFPSKLQIAQNLWLSADQRVLIIHCLGSRIVDRTFSGNKRVASEPVT